MTVRQDARGIGGMWSGDVKVDWAAIKAKRDAVVARLNGIYASNLSKSGVTAITGEAHFVGPNTVKVGDDEYTVRTLKQCTATW